MAEQKEKTASKEVDTLTYGEPVTVEGGVRLYATDAEGNTLTVTAETAEKAMAALPQAFEAFHAYKAK
ncbi:hypothetical protein [Deinococcus apachensis]|uniref:hypothetical protein n=1 Tax=Deinococcus apachensis TaxID=309886 RepID=UPI00037021E1|nr:hypothetical protein [Deinococcus apachensis]